jgi:hypothetical protein
VLADVLDLFSEKTEETQTAGLCDLISGEINHARSMLLDVSEAVQMLSHAEKCQSMSWSETTL